MLGGKHARCEVAAARDLQRGRKAAQRFLGVSRISQRIAHGHAGQVGHGHRRGAGLLRRRNLLTRGCRAEKQRVAGPDMAGAAERADGTGPRQAMFAEPGDHLRGDEAAGRAAVDADVLGAVGLEQLPVHRLHVFGGGREPVLRRQAIVHRHHRDPRRGRHRDRLDQRTTARAPHEGAAMHVDEDALAVTGRDVRRRCHPVHPDAAQALLLDPRAIGALHLHQALIVEPAVVRARLADVAELRAAFGEDPRGDGIGLRAGLAGVRQGELRNPD